jgi:hypothetical protein
MKQGKKFELPDIRQECRGVMRLLVAIVMAPEREEIEIGTAEDPKGNKVILGLRDGSMHRLTTQDARSLADLLICGRDLHPRPMIIPQMVDSLRRAADVADGLDPLVSRE